MAKTRTSGTALAVILALAVAALFIPAGAGIDEAKKWVEKEFQPSTLTKEQQMKEMEFFVNAAKPFKGMEINVLSETIPTHEYEAKVLTKAFQEITGIKVNHQLLGEGEVVQAVQTQMQTNRNLYDAYINDSDLIGTHSRLQSAVNLTDWMAGEGKDVTLPTLDVNDFIGKSFTTGPDGKLWQLPDQQFANLYWFRYDWFKRPDLKAKFKEKYGYELGVPVDWSAYEDIAEFFSVDVKTIDGVRIYGHMDYGKRAPDLGWRMTDAWLSMAGAGSKGLPNGRPIDEWGIRMEPGSCNPAGASVSRGGETNGPAAVYAVRKWDEWLRKYAPPGAADYDFYQSLPALAQGNVAQQVFWYTAFTASMVAPKSAGNNTVDDKGVPLWRMAPSPHGPYWEEGMKLGYQDAGSWTLFKSTPIARRKAAWLYAQFTVSKTVVAQEEPRGADDHPRLRHQPQVVHRPRAEARRARRVLPVARPGPVDADRRQRAGLPEAGAALVAEHRRRQLGHLHAAAGDGPPGQGDGPGDGADGGSRQEGQGLRGLRPAAQRREGPERVAGQAERAQGQARQREAQGSHGRLRRADQALGEALRESITSDRTGSPGLPVRIPGGGRDPALSAGFGP